MIDAHLHLDQYDLNKLEFHIDMWRNHGIKGVVAVATNLQSSYKTLELKLKYPTFIRAAIGHHPEAPPSTSKDLAELLNLIKKEKNHLSGIGEIGLPTYQKESLYEVYGEEPFFEQLEALLEIAKSVDLPVALHAVHEESEKVLLLLKKHEIKKAHFHWLKASNQIVQDIISCGYYVSVTPEVCYRERDQRLAKMIPMDQLLIETDGPWKHSGHFQHQDTTPLFLKDIVDSLSNIFSLSTVNINEILMANTKRLYD